MIEEGFLWSSKDGFIGESCLGYLYCKFAKLATLFGITTAEDNERERERERENSDCDLVTTLIKTITPAELEKLQVHGRELDKKYGLIYGETTLFESKQGIFATDGANTSIFTENDDKLLVIYYTTCSVYMMMINGRQLHFTWGNLTDTSVTDK